jgi:hypothetical protein
MMHQVDDRSYFAPAWESLSLDIAELAVVRERYPELVSGEDQPRRSLVEFDFIHVIALGVSDDRALSRWTMYSSIAEAFAARLHADARSRERVAQGVGLSLAEFDAGLRVHGDDVDVAGVVAGSGRLAGHVEPNEVSLQLEVRLHDVFIEVRHAPDATPSGMAFQTASADAHPAAVTGRVRPAMG